MLLMTVMLAVADPGETKIQSEQHSIQMFRQLDADHDGYLTYDEVRLAGLRVLKRNATIADLTKLPDAPHSRALFDRADADHDGRVSLAEIVAAADRDFEEADTDQDGFLSGDERAAYMMRAVDAAERDMGNVPAMPCTPGAMCDTNRQHPKVK